MARFVVFDVETPNSFNNRMSAIGISVIEDGKIVEEFYSLVNPETHFDYFHVRLTGISEESVADAPTFGQLWPKIQPLMESGLLVAHNAAFDMNVLKKCLQAYEIDWKPYAHYICTVQMGRQLLPGIGHKLNELCDYYGIELDHHQADSDSHACAEILLHYLAGGADIKKLFRTCSFTE